MGLRKRKSGGWREDENKARVYRANHFYSLNKIENNHFHTHFGKGYVITVKGKKYSYTKGLNLRFVTSEDINDIWTIRRL